MKIYSSEFADHYENDLLSVTFGNEKSEELINREVIHFGKQSHEAQLLKVDQKKIASLSQVISSDGQFTEIKNLKLGVYTADCIPCFIISKSQVFSLHLGWKSIAKGLFDQALEIVGQEQRLDIFVGPHIQKASFEVGEDMIEHFKTLPAHSNQKWCSQKPDGKHLVSLLEILKIKAEGYNAVFYTSPIDTFKSKEHHSYRGDKQTSKRNISFAFLKD